MAYRATNIGIFQSSPTRIERRHMTMVCPRQLSTEHWGSGLAEHFPSISPVTVNSSLLKPVSVEIDPEYHQIRTEEKEQIKVLNNQFASFINKVSHLEQQNKMLETKWSLLQEQTTARSNIDAMFEAYISNLRHHLDSLGHEKVRLEGDLHNMRDLMEDFKKKYEEENEECTICENEFVLMKKDSDLALVTRAELEATLDNLNDEVQFLKMLYDMEHQELLAQVKDTSVVVEMDNSRNLDMDAIVAEVKAQYEDIANRSRAEAEAWYRHKYEEMQVSATKYGDELKSSKVEIAEFNQRVSRIQSEIDLIKGQRALLETQIAEAEGQGEQAVKDARARITDLEAALQRAKQDMARQVREYQDLMNIKLALDIEIATYRKLLEGEESRLEHGIQAISISKESSSSRLTNPSSLYSSHSARSFISSSMSTLQMNGSASVRLAEAKRMY